jgi:thiol-disulfide isomerase/thioredoxin
MNKIKKTLGLSILLIGLLFQLKAQKKEGFSITLHLAGLTNYTKAYLITVNKDAKGDEMFITSDTIGRAMSKEGIFTFSGKVNSYGQWFNLMIENQEKYLPLILGNEQLKITGELSNWPKVEVIGSPGTIDYMAYTKVSDSLQINDRYEEKAAFRKQYVENHPNSLYATFLILRSSRMSAEEKQIAYNKLTPFAKNSYWGTRIPAIIKMQLLAKKIQPTATLPGFKVSTPEGQSISVLEYVKKGKITLIDFWASWCHPCREETPNMKKVYDAFHDKGFNIIGISTDSKEADWKKALGEDKTTWFHGRDNLEHASKGLFSISAIPAFALVDREGKLIAFDCGMSNIASFGPEIRGEGLYKTIDDLLKDKSK